MRVAIWRSPGAILEALRSPWPLLAVAVTYCTLSTADIEIGPIPGKFLVTVLALAVWLAQRGRAYVPWRLPILAFGLLVPLMGVAVALAGTVTDDPAQALGLRSAAEEASRFVYVLLALPLLDWVRTQSSRRRAERIWLWPVAALAGLTWLLYVAYLAGADFDGSGAVGPLRGDIAQDPASGVFRAFLVTQVLFIPAVLLLFRRIHADPRQPFDAPLLILLLGAVMISHTRGLWIGLVLGSGAYLVLELANAKALLRRPPAIAVAGLGLVALIVLLSAPTILGGTEAAAGASESSNVRLKQVPELLDGFYDNPVVGSGMGAVLPSGYRRSEQVPWSFELAYMQLLFQLGIVGMLLLAWLPLAVMRDAVSVMLADPPRHMPAAAGVASIVGLLVIYASNPYLITSAGTMALAISVSMCEPVAQRRAGSWRRVRY